MAVLNDYLIYSYKKCRIQKTKPTLSNNYRKGAWNNNHYKSGNSIFNNLAQNPNSFYNNQNSYKYGNRFNLIKQYDQNFSENIHLGKMNLLLNSSMSVKTANQAHSNMRPTLQQDTKSYNTQNENNVQWIQQEENNDDYFDAISDFKLKRKKVPKKKNST